MAWIWVAIYAGQFFDQRAVRIQVAVIGVASAAALAICGLPGLVTAWVLIAGSCDPRRRGARAGSTRVCGPSW